MAKQLIVTGDKELNKTLAALPASLQKKAIRQATRQLTKNEVVDAIERRAAASGYKISRFTDNIKVRALKRSRSKIGYTAIIPVDESLVTSDKKGRRYWKPNIFEFGARSRGGDRRDEKRSYGRIRPVAFMSGGLTDAESAVRGRFPNIVKSRLTEVVADAKRKGKL